MVVVGVRCTAVERKYIAVGNSRKYEHEPIEPINPNTTPRFVMNIAPIKTIAKGIIVSAACCKGVVSVSPNASACLRANEQEQQLEKIPTDMNLLEIQPFLQNLTPANHKDCANCVPSSLTRKYIS